jgi:hypothetical protein
MDAPANSTTPDFIDTTNPHGAEPLVSAEEIAAIARQALEDVNRWTAGSVGAALGTPPAPEEAVPAALAPAPAPAAAEHVAPVAHVAPSSPWTPAPSAPVAHVPVAPMPAPSAPAAQAEVSEEPAKSATFEVFDASEPTFAEEPDSLAPLRSAADYAAQNPLGLALASFALGVFVGVMLPGRRAKPQEESDVEAAAA